MAKIKIFQSDTYPSEVVTIKKQLQQLPAYVLEKITTEEYLRDYICDAIWDSDSPCGKLYDMLMVELESHEVVAYHNTRLSNTDSIRKNGLIFSDDRYVKQLQRAMAEVGINSDTSQDVLALVNQEINRWNSKDGNRRKNEICFFFDMDYYLSYDKFLAIYGGEFLEFGLTAHDLLRKYKTVAKIGHPYVIEFSIPFCWLSKFEKMDIARYMLEEWVHLDLRKDNTDHQYSGRIEKEIPSEFIIAIHQVPDNFPDLDKYFFGKKQ